MKKTTLKNRLEKLGISKNTVACRIVKEMTGLYSIYNKSNGKTETIKTYHLFGNVIRPCYTSGSGKFTVNQNHTASVTSLLNLLKIKYTFGNDAPRGSETGNFIVVTTKLI